MAETTTATSLPASTSRLTWRGDVADALDVGDGRAAEFHDDNSHRLTALTPVCLRFQIHAGKSMLAAERAIPAAATHRPRPASDASRKDPITLS
jgi:hypothetical protein